VAAIFCAVAPPLGGRCLEERERKTRSDAAAFLRARAEEHFPEAERIVPVQDHLNTPSPASLYAACPPAEAARIGARYECHFPPQPGSWRHLAEIELRVLARGCLARRIPDRTTLARELRGNWAGIGRELGAWQRDRNQAAPGIRWQFTTDEARVQLQPTPSIISPLTGHLVPARGLVPRAVGRRAARDGRRSWPPRR
jgi:hypothetical protein